MYIWAFFTPYRRLLGFGSCECQAEFPFSLLQPRGTPWSLPNYLASRAPTPRPCLRLEVPREAKQRANITGSREEPNISITHQLVVDATALLVQKCRSHIILLDFLLQLQLLNRSTREVREIRKRYLRRRPRAGRNQQFSPQNHQR